MTWLAKSTQSRLLVASALCAGALLAAAAPAGAAGLAPPRTTATASAAHPAAPAAPGTAAAPEEDAAVRAIERAAHPLLSTDPSGGFRDLRPFGRTVGDATIVGIGEATHGSHEFFAFKHRAFRYLVQEKGFRTFALEAPWSTGLRLDDYVRYGKGDPRQIMREEFRNAYRVWRNQEYLELIEWMRSWNTAHPGDPVRFMGNDFGYAGPELYDRVTSYVGRRFPALLPRFTALYQGLRPTTDVDTYMDAYMAKPLSERREMARRTGQALAMLEGRRPGGGHAEREAYTWAVQHARAIDQTARGYAFDFDDPAAMRYRDQLMADNTVWWQRHTGDRVLLSAHDAHVSYETSFPEAYPKMQGAFIRDRVGSAYLSVGFTFDRGSFNASGPDGVFTEFTVGPAGPGSNERTLDAVRYRDYLVDMRTAPAAARDWLAVARPTRSIGAAYPENSEFRISLLPSHDALIHLHRISAARPLDR
ncbi:erythromycin esterase family protein [Streptomyces palmae]|uniref:Erythromycin esterase family protein n=1 Tax=Streptomyces palmae TaxID=1701085 RepID=A0A4Z0H8P9_9ACTN|nr:erythromycin esterase family protein [Streptomyces palmae]TGB13102.1 erythromycin esterase family protein [Streptomyces palmae]